MVEKMSNRELVALKKRIRAKWREWDLTDERLYWLYDRIRDEEKKRDRETKQHFMVAIWYPHRGSTKDDPAIASGSGCYNVYFPLFDLNLDYCYTSAKRAQRVADKRNEHEWRWGARHAVIEVFKESVDEEGVVWYGWKYVNP